MKHKIILPFTFIFLTACNSQREEPGTILCAQKIESVSRTDASMEIDSMPISYSEKVDSLVISK